MPTELPFIDELETTVTAPADRVFLSVARHVGRGFGGRVPEVFSRLLGCVHRGTPYTVPPIVGQEASGFRVARVQQPQELILEGQHRFATYRLSFFVDAIGLGESRLRARTDALFPGIKGAMYRALVIGSGGHEFVVKGMLRAIAGDAAREQKGQERRRQ